MKKLTQAQQERLLKKADYVYGKVRDLPGVIDVEIGEQLRGGEETGELAIRILVEKKYSDGWLKRKKIDILPKALAGLPIDVIECHEEPHGPRDGMFDPLVGGVATTASHIPNEVGTLGAVVFDNNSEARLALSNQHVWGGNGRIVIQPFGSTSGQIGSVIRSSQGLDCAVARLNDSRTPSSSILGLGFRVAGVAPPTDRMRVVKSGRTTEVTHGIVQGVGRRRVTIAPDPARQAPNGISRGGDFRQHLV